MPQTSAAQKTAPERPQSHYELLGGEPLMRVNGGSLMAMRTAILLMGSILAVAGCGRGQQQNPQRTAAENVEQTPATGRVEEGPSVPLVGPAGQILGEVRGGDSAQGAVLRIDAKGLPPGVHGIHIHSVGRCEGPSFESAGPHWNPENKQHGFD